MDCTYSCFVICPSPLTFVYNICGQRPKLKQVNPFRCISDQLTCWDWNNSNRQTGQKGKQSKSQEECLLTSESWSASVHEGRLKRLCWSDSDLLTVSPTSVLIRDEMWADITLMHTVRQFAHTKTFLYSWRPLNKLVLYKIKIILLFF